MTNNRILLINPPQDNNISVGLDDEFVDMIGYYPPLGLLYIGTMLQHNGFDVKIIDCVPKHMSYTELEQEIRQYAPFVTGITTYTTSIFDVLQTAALVKKIDSNCSVILGGHHASLYPKETARYENVNFIIRGEGEYAFLEISRALQQGATNEAIKHIEGIGFCENEDVFIHPRRAVVEDLNAIPIINRNLLDADTYRSVVGRAEKVATVMSSRGCPFQCTFCYTPDKKYRSRSVENIMQEIELLAKDGFREIFFFDDLFALKAEKVIEISQEIKKRKLEIEWSFRARISTVTKELLQEVKSSGCHRIQFGIESGNDTTLQRIKKGTNTQQIAEAIKLCRENKITTIGNFILGLPDESLDDVKNTVRFSRKIGLDFAQYNILIPYPFTAIYKEGLEKGIIEKDVWLELADDPMHVSPVFEVPYWLDLFGQDEIFEITRHAFKQFYFRPSIILQKLKAIKTWPEFVNHAKGALSVLKF